MYNMFWSSPVRLIFISAHPAKFAMKLGENVIINVAKW